MGFEAKMGFQKDTEILIIKEEARFQGICWVYAPLKCWVVDAPRSLSQIC